MKINLQQLKLYREDAVYYQYNGQMDDDFLADNGAGLQSAVKIALTINRRDQIFYGTGTLETVIEYNCSRCLKGFTRTISPPLSFIIAEPGGEKDYDEEVLLLENDEVDITSYLQGVIFAEIPLSPICDPNCKGLCPFCGGDKNIKDCQCRNEEIDPRWEKLKRLNREGG